MHCVLQCRRMRVQACIALPAVYNCVLFYTKSKAGNVRSSNSFVNVLKQKVCMHYICITHTGSTGH